MDWSITTILRITFWTAVGLLGYTFFVYPLLLVLMASTHQVIADLSFALTRASRRSRLSDSDLPFVSFVFSAHNEESVIAQKMRNCVELRYPADRLEILVGCDGCSDGTAEIARRAGLPNAQVCEWRLRSGKPAVLNRLAAEARGTILVFSDANTFLDPRAILSLVRHFSDPKVGCACGELRLRSPAGKPSTEGLYWRYETFLKFLESRLNALVGANGAVFAIRRELFSPLPPKGIIDDFLVAMRIRARGFRNVYDPEAVAHETAAASTRLEFQRRVRIGAGNFHALRFTWRLLLPTAGLVAFSYWSHKVCRWIAPFALVTAFLSALALSAAQPFYTAIVALAVGFAGLAFIGYHLESRQVHRSLFSVPYYFLSMNFALLLGFAGYLNGGQTAMWRRTAREHEAL
jgi:cellulose synthase/poly-beta-1,6-N-acetylglucosamine synthase-like glycosyltransferase